MSTQKVAVITGASQGIGAASSTRTASSATRSSRTPAPSRRPTIPMILTVAGDIADPAVGARVIEQALAAFGRIDTLINNAGVFVAKPFTDYTDEDYDAGDRREPARLLRGLASGPSPRCSTDGGGHVVNISTSLVDHANSRVPSALASLTKGGLNAVTKSLAIEYAARGIRVNAVSPGIIRTPMHPAETHDTPRRPAPARPDGRDQRHRRRDHLSGDTPRSSPARSCTSTAARAPATDIRQPIPSCHRQRKPQ